MAKNNCDNISGLKKALADLQRKSDEIKERLPDDSVEIYEAHRKKDGTYHIGKLISRQV